MLKKLFFILLLILTDLFIPSFFNTPKQLLIVKINSKQINKGLLQRYERDNHPSWKKIGIPIPVVIGENGIALNKREGDKKTPAGVYKIDYAFGFAKHSNLKLAYLFLTDTMECVDDTQSIYYNQIIDYTKVKKIDWKSSEKMREIPFYKLGAMISYNTSHPVKGAGSCIFMHIWVNPSQGTSGCIAMEEKNLKTILEWLDSDKKPMISIL